MTDEFGFCALKKIHNPPMLFLTNPKPGQEIVTGDLWFILHELLLELPPHSPKSINLDYDVSDHCLKHSLR